MATLKEMFEGNTSKVLEATELLKVLSQREGQFVWKKFNKSVGEVTIKMTASKSGSNHVLTLTCDKIDLSKIDSSFFIGKEFISTNNAYLMKFTSETQFVTGSGSAFTYTYNPSTKQITAPVSSWSVTTWKDYVYTEKPVFLGEYVVANTEDAYPNGGEQDGYWYELVEDIDFLTVSMGCTEFVESTFTVTTRTSTSKIFVPCKTSKKPKFVLLWCESYPQTNSDIYSIAVLNYLSLESSYGEISAYNQYSSNPNYINADDVILDSSFWDSNGVMFNPVGATYYFQAGKVYKVFMAC